MADYNNNESIYQAGYDEGYKAGKAAAEEAASLLFPGSEGFYLGEPDEA
jgi:hypothetical protein